MPNDKIPLYEIDREQLARAPAQTLRRVLQLALSDSSLDYINKVRVDVDTNNINILRSAVLEIHGAEQSAVDDDRSFAPLYVPRALFSSSTTSTVLNDDQSADDNDELLSAPPSRAAIGVAENARDVADVFANSSPAPAPMPGSSSSTTTPIGETVSALGFEDSVAGGARARQKHLNFQISAAQTPIGRTASTTPLAGYEESSGRRQLSNDNDDGELDSDESGLWRAALSSALGYYGDLPRAPLDAAREACQAADLFDFPTAAPTLDEASSLLWRQLLTLSQPPSMSGAVRNGLEANEKELYVSQRDWLALRLLLTLLDDADGDDYELLWRVLLDVVDHRVRDAGWRRLKTGFAGDEQKVLDVNDTHFFRSPAVRALRERVAVTTKLFGGESTSAANPQSQAKPRRRGKRGGKRGGKSDVHVSVVDNDNRSNLKGKANAGGGGGKANSGSAPPSASKTNN
jgi:hypothetical protein